ncbi:MAG: PD-(D/E)XK nuclease family protein [Pelolinea sp.]|nr:PD-(D/E)XK nuclease family protein [Pelolinea sp.]
MAENNRCSFSAANIQDYLDCERRYELKYILEQSWPAISSEPVIEIEDNIRKGNKFHYLIYQFFSDVPENALIPSIEEKEIEEWFNSFLLFHKTIQLKMAFPEFRLTGQIGEARLSAVYDLIYLTQNNEIRIMDWKTSHYIPKKTALAVKVQTILYPYLLKETSHEFLPEISLSPENISMQYWYPSAPNEVFIFKYGRSTHENHRVFLENIINEILGKKVGEFALTNNERKCGFCPYRSLCNRGISASNMLELIDEVSEENDFLIDFDLLPELPFDE